MGADELVVRPRAIAAIAEDVAVLGRTMRQAEQYLDAHVSSSVTGGWWIYDAGQMIDGIRDSLRPIYGRYPERVLDGSRDIEEILDSYLRTDRDQWAAYDRLNRKVIRNQDGAGVRITPATDSSELEHLIDRDAGPDFGRAVARGILADPAAYETGARGLWVDINEQIEELLSFADQAEDLTILGIGNPFTGWVEKWEGNWEEIGTSAAAIEALADYWKEVGAQSLDILQRFPGRWEGLAANNVAWWLRSLARNAWEHGEGMDSVADELSAKGALLYSTLIPLLEACADLVDIVFTAVDLLGSASDPGEILNVFKDPLGYLSDKWDDAKRLRELIERIIEFIGKIDKYAALAIAAVEAVSTIVEGLDTETWQLFEFWEGRSMGPIEVGV